MSSIRVILACFEATPRELPVFMHQTGDLDRIFRLLNWVEPGDAQAAPTGGQHRSLTAGDIVYVDDQPWGCAAFGWCKLTQTQVDAYLALSERERLCAYREWDEVEANAPQRG